MSRMFSRPASVIAVTLIAAFFSIAIASAQDQRQNAPGQFDFYVLALSWSPSYCEAAGDRASNRSNALQCGARPFSFVVHGLWPQYEKGFPEYCQRDAEKLDRSLISSMLDLMPSADLIFHEWQRHGVCAGLSAHRYFDLIRQTRAAIKIPAEFTNVTAPLTVSPDQIEDAFVKANTGLTRQGIAVACNRQRLSEVRICIAKDGSFRACEEIDRRACRAQTVTMPPVRGASSAGGSTAANASAATPTAVGAAPASAAATR